MTIPGFPKNITLQTNRHWIFILTAFLPVFYHYTSNSCLLPESTNRYLPCLQQYLLAPPRSCCFSFYNKSSVFYNVWSIPSLILLLTGIPQDSVHTDSQYWSHLRFSTPFLIFSSPFPLRKTHLMSNMEAGTKFYESLYSQHIAWYHMNIFFPSFVHSTVL